MDFFFSLLQGTTLRVIVPYKLHMFIRQISPTLKYCNLPGYDLGRPGYGSTLSRFLGTCRVSISN